MIKNLLRAVAFALALVGSSGVTFAITLEEISRFDIDSSSDVANAEFIGTNPAAVAWNGRLLYVAGFNNGGSDATVSIVPITNTASSGLQSATYGSTFGTLNAAGLRGYSGLDISEAGLAAAADTIGGAIPEGIAAFDLSGNGLWTKSQRGGSGVGFDPGFGGIDAGVGHTSFGSGRRALQDTANGADIYTSGSGMIINGAGTGTFWRDMDFSPNGDIWLREGNNVIQGVRSGGNALSATQLIVDEPEADFVNLQTLAYLDGTADGDFVIYNDRETAGPGQAFADVVKVIDVAGNSAAVSWSLLAPIDDGGGAYDFSWDAATQTLAVSDFTNRNVHLFRAVPEPSAFASMVLAAAIVLGRMHRR